MNYKKLAVISHLSIQIRGRERDIRWGNREDYGALVSLHREPYGPLASLPSNDELKPRAENRTLELSICNERSTRGPHKKKKKKMGMKSKMCMMEIG